MNWITSAIVLLVMLPWHAACAADASPWPRDFTYMLQADSFGEREIAVEKLAACGRDLIVLDVSYDGSADGRWTHDELIKIRTAHPGRKIVAYLSIGEAEDYRSYWQPAWKTAPPDWLLGANPDWPGNYRVKYWNPVWQQIMLAQLDTLMDQGFDGVYLDIVDAFETFEQSAPGNETIDNRINDTTHNTYRQDMIAWVTTIAERARKKNPMFMVIPQNGSQLLANDGYLQTISAIGVEDLFTLDDKKQSTDHTRYITDYLARAMAVGKPVLVIEYPRKKALRDYAAEQCRSHGYRLLLTDRALQTLGQSPGH